MRTVTECRTAPTSIPTETAPRTRLIWTETGQLPAVFTYPYGRYSAESEDILEELGFRATLTCDFGVNRIEPGQDCLFGLKRICRSHGADLGALLQEAFNTQNGR